MPSTMISVADALARITGALEPVPTEQVSVADSLGRVLARDVVSRVTQPPSDVSSMDGYAVRAADLAKVPVTLKLIGEAPAGGAHEGTVGPGQSVRIFTGGPLPKGADSVVMQENTESDGKTVTILEAVRKGRFVRPAGLDFKEGDTGVSAGRVLNAREVGLAASMNVPWLTVRRRPRVAILATGDEVVMPGDPLGPNQIISSNGLVLAAFVRAHGGVPQDLGIAGDTVEALQTMAGGARGADILVTTGGASVGEHDLVQSALGGTGLEVNFWKIAMRPGKPVIFGHYHGTPFLGLPGNPVSSLVCAVLYLGPAMDKLLGLERDDGPAPTARLGRDLGANDFRQDYLRARLSYNEDGELVATPFEMQDSSMLLTLARADCLIVRAPEAPPAAAGERVEIIPLPREVVAV